MTTPLQKMIPVCPDPCCPSPPQAKIAVRDLCTSVDRMEVIGTGHFIIFRQEPAVFQGIFICMPGRHIFQYLHLFFQRAPHGTLSNQLLHPFFRSYRLPPILAMLRTL